MTYTNLLSWQPLPQFEDGDIVRGGNLAGMTNVDQGKKVRFIGCNLAGCITTLEQLPSDKNLICPPFPAFEYTEADFELASQATIVYNALVGSSQLTSEQITSLQQMVGAVNQVAGTTAELGAAATSVVEQMIAKLQINNPELATQVGQMLVAVQSGWRAE